MRRYCSFVALRVSVDLLPSRSLRFSGSCQLSITAQSVHVVDVSDPGHQPELRRVFWPVASIRHCGYNDKLLLLRTGQLVHAFVIIQFRMHRRNTPGGGKPSGVTRGGRTAQGDTLEGVRDTRMKKMWLSLEKRRQRVGVVRITTAKKVIITLQRAMTKKGRQFFRKK